MRNPETFLDSITPHEEHVSDFTLDRDRLEGLPSEDAAKVTRHLGTCGRCAARARSLAEADRAALPEFEDRVGAAPAPPPATATATAIAIAIAPVAPGAAIAPLTEARPRRERGSPLLTHGLRAALALAACAVAVVLVRPLLGGDAGDRKSTHAKGGESLEVFVRHSGGAVESVLPGTVLLPGEAVRFRVSSERRSFLIVLGLDSAGVVTAHYPLGTNAAPIGPAHDLLLEGSVVLDASIGQERFIGLFCAEPLPVERALQAARTALAQANGNPARVESLALPCQERTFTFQKQLRRP